MILKRKSTYIALLATLFAFVLFADPAWAQATLTVEKNSAPEPVQVGQSLVYTIDVSNADATGSQAATGVMLTDSLPANTTFVSSTSGAGVAPCNTPAVGATTGTITCNFGTINDGATEDVQIVVRPTAAATTIAGGPGSVTNTATADGSNTSPASDTESTAVQPISGLTITKDDNPDPVDVGESLIYTITVDNNTSETLNLDLVDDLPNSVDFIALQPTSACEETSGIVTCEIDNLAPADPPFVVQIAVEPQQAGTINNTPQLFCDSTVAANCPSDDPDTVTPIAQTTESTVVQGDNPPPDGSITITKEASPTSVEVDDTVTYTLTVTNDGTTPANNLTIQDDLPSEVDFDSSPDCTSSGGTVTCDLDPIAANGGQEEVQFDVTAQDNADNVENTAQVLSGEEVIDEDSASIDIGNNNNDNGNGNRQYRVPPFFRGNPFFRNNPFSNNDNQYDDNGNADINSEATTSTADQYDNGAASDSAGPGGAQAQSGGSPDQYAPESGPRGDVVDEVPTEGPLPNTGGLPILAVILPVAGFLVLGAAMIARIRNSR